jgi:hypothetical protein
MLNVYMSLQRCGWGSVSADERRPLLLQTAMSYGDVNGRETCRSVDSPPGTARTCRQTRLRHSAHCVARTNLNRGSCVNDITPRKCSRVIEVKLLAFIARTFDRLYPHERAVLSFLFVSHKHVVMKTQKGSGGKTPRVYSETARPSLPSRKNCFNLFSATKLDATKI